jgi:hypothetical protein
MISEELACWLASANEAQLRAVCTRVCQASPQAQETARRLIAVPDRLTWCVMLDCYIRTAKAEIGSFESFDDQDGGRAPLFQRIEELLFTDCLDAALAVCCGVHAALTQDGNRQIDNRYAAAGITLLLALKACLGHKNLPSLEGDARRALFSAVMFHRPFAMSEVPRVAEKLNEQVALLASDEEFEAIATYGNWLVQHFKVDHAPANSDWGSFMRNARAVRRNSHRIL